MTHHSGPKISGASSNHSFVAHCHFGLGKLYRRTNKREQALEHLTTATTMYRDMGMTYWLRKAEAEVQSASLLSPAPVRNHDQPAAGAEQQQGARHDQALVEHRNRLNGLGEQGQITRLPGAEVGVPDPNQARPHERQAE
jgi:hypothetical protein